MTDDELAQFVAPFTPLLCEKRSEEAAGLPSRRQFPDLQFPPLPQADRWPSLEIFRIPYVPLHFPLTYGEDRATGGCGRENGQAGF